MSNCNHMLDIMHDEHHGKSKSMCFLCDKTEREIQLEETIAKLARAFPFIKRLLLEIEK